MKVDMSIQKQRKAHHYPQVHPVVAFCLGVLALYLSRSVFTGSIFAENFPFVPHALHNYIACIHLALCVVVTIVGAFALVIGGLALHKNGLNEPYSVAVLIGAVSGGIALIMGVLYLTFILHVTY